MTAVVVDTNVIVVANDRAEHAGPGCVAACILAMRDIRAAGRVVVDDGYRIFREYQRYLRTGGQPGAGDAFVLWLFRNQANPQHCEQVSITQASDDPDDFAAFPTDASLHTFDRSDRKFVAVARSSDSRPPILNATDTGWWFHCVQSFLDRQKLDYSSADEQYCTKLTVKNRGQTIPVSIYNSGSSLD